ncbi:unnamed protein product [Rotaria socialis]|uniref:Ty3 transposon capsid-like protein domain-containing protein n=3 Tax=Rotaria socialis TaxID=392032 RepID=A0A818DDN9_9BILA|nr:unnamed protein product [Rotaria socialis]CAF3441854.1 unnamed protein product [Rotaria socialis]CAF4622536.1 unnamed protein product [Rotaria socialis]
MKKSSSSSSLDLPDTSADLILTSTLDPITTSVTSELKRRMDIIPTPNRPDRLVKSADVSTNNIAESSLLTTLLSTEAPTFKEDDRVKHDHNSDALEIPYQVESSHTKKDAKNDTEGEDATFDSFIYEHFVPFSGKEQLNKWLDETDALFRRFKISRHLRLQAVPLLVSGDAQRQYIRSRHSIKSFDDFYEFLLTYFDSAALTICSSNSNKVNHKVEFATDTMDISNLSSHSALNTKHTTDTTALSHSCISCSSKLINDDTTTKIGDVSDTKSAINTSKNNHSSSDSVIPDLRKAIIANFIRNPKTFRGYKDDVTKWLDEIDYVMQIAHVPEENRLDLISYSLRGDANQWFKNNKSLLTSWDKFTQEIKKAFSSSFSEELAFKTLESYAQGENQSVRNFFNEILKLCKRADSNMSESTKLKNLLNKVKPSIQLEVRKKKPNTTTEFLEYATEIEELFQLSNISTNATFSSASKSKDFSKNEGTSNNSSFQYSNSNRSNYRSSPQTKFSNNIGSGTNTPNKKYTFNSDRTQVSNSNYYSQSASPSLSTNQYSENTDRHKKINRQQRKNLYNNPNHKSASRSANAVFTSNLSPTSDDNISTLSTVVCQLCNIMGHDASSCQNFQ